MEGEVKRLKPLKSYNEKLVPFQQFNFLTFHQFDFDNPQLHYSASFLK